MASLPPALLVDGEKPHNTVTILFHGGYLMQKVDGDGTKPEHVEQLDIPPMSAALIVGLDDLGGVFRVLLGHLGL